VVFAGGCHADSRGDALKIFTKATLEQFHLDSLPLHALLTADRLAFHSIQSPPFGTRDQEKSIWQNETSTPQ
jgi:hypothetical protein